MPKIPLEPIKRLERLTAWHRGDAGALGVIKSPMHPVETYEILHVDGGQSAGH
jgi:hypothetical protein